jgi:surface protein
MSKSLKQQIGQGLIITALQKIQKELNLLKNKFFNINKSLNLKLNEIQTSLELKLNKVSTVDVEKVYIKNADGTQGIKATSEFIGGAEQLEVSGAITAVESWKNKVILITNDSTITIPSALFTKDWTARIIVLNGFLILEKLGSRNWYFGNPEPLINKGSDFIIRQRALTQDLIVRGQIVSNPFVASFDTRNTQVGGSTDSQVKLPFTSGNFQPCIVDWGDGIVENVTAFNAVNTLHTYINKGEYKVKIYGKGFSLVFQGPDSNKIGEIFSWGNIVIVAVSFLRCANLTAVNVTDIPIITDGNQVFRSCSSLTTVNRMNEWNVSNVTAMQYMFYNAASFNQPIGNWSVSNVTNFIDFMAFKTAANYSSANYDAILNGWSSRPVKPSISINFGTIKHTSAGTAGKAILTGAQNNWTIIDGGL